MLSNHIKIITSAQRHVNANGNGSGGGTLRYGLHYALRFTQDQFRATQGAAEEFSPMQTLKVFAKRTFRVLLTDEPTLKKPTGY